jgi:hypothetical protein
MSFRPNIIFYVLHMYINTQSFINTQSKILTSGVVVSKVSCCSEVNGSNPDNVYID